jgi:hypothetical protein
MFSLALLTTAFLANAETYETPFTPNGVLSISRTVNKLNAASAHLTVDHGCSSSDAYGSNDCQWNWGDTLGLDYSVALTEDISSGKIAINAKLDSIIPFAASCPACGANCSITIPIVNIPVTFAMPDCPLTHFSLSNVTSVILPASNPIGAKTTAKGSVTLTDQTGQTVLDVSFDATLN